MYDSLTDALAGADVVLLSLPTPRHVRQVVDEIVTLTTGALVIDSSTIDPGTAREVAEELRAAGSGYVDAPVLGRPDRCGAWLMPMGGDPADVTLAEQVVVGTIASAVAHVGEVGTGSTLKILNNLMLGTINAITAEAVQLAETVGLDPHRFVSVVADSGAASVSPMFREVGPKMAARDFSPTFTLNLLLKDITLANDLAEAAHATAPIAAQVLSLTRAAVDRGLGDQDTSALIELYRDTVRS